MCRIPKWVLPLGRCRFGACGVELLAGVGVAPFGASWADGPHLRSEKWGGEIIRGESVDAKLPRPWLLHEESAKKLRPHTYMHKGWRHSLLNRHVLSRLAATFLGPERRSGYDLRKLCPCGPAISKRTTVRVFHGGQSPRRCGGREHVNPYFLRGKKKNRARWSDDQYRNHGDKNATDWADIFTRIISPGTMTCDIVQIIYIYHEPHTWLIILRIKSGLAFRSASQSLIISAALSLWVVGLPPGSVQSQCPKYILIICIIYTHIYIYI